MGTSTGPRSVMPTTPVVLVLTPSMGLLPVSISSTKTPGARYSGITLLLSASVEAHLSAKDEVNVVLAGPVERHERDLDVGVRAAVVRLHLDLRDTAQGRQAEVAVGVARRREATHEVVLGGERVSADGVGAPVYLDDAGRVQPRQGLEENGRVAGDALAAQFVVRARGLRRDLARDRPGRVLAGRRVDERGGGG